MAARLDNRSIKVLAVMSLVGSNGGTLASPAVGRTCAAGTEGGFTSATLAPSSEADVPALGLLLVWSWSFSMMGSGTAVTNINKRERSKSVGSRYQNVLVFLDRKECKQIMNAKTESDLFVIRYAVVA